MSKQPPKQNTKARDPFSWIDDGFPSLKFSDPFPDIFNPMPIWKLIKKVNKTIAEEEILMAKHESAVFRCTNRAKLVPMNATIRREYVKCTKPNCYHKKHGPYYYAYWKDPANKRLRKKYIGRHFEKANLSANMEQTEKGDSTPSQPELDQQDKKKKKRKVLVIA
jgi:hypothetical protein